jgi:hypothetical protein
MKHTIIGRAVGAEGEHAEVRLSGVAEEAINAGLLSAIEDGISSAFERAFNAEPTSAVAVVLPYAEELDEGRGEDSIPSTAYARSTT